MGFEVNVIYHLSTWTLREYYFVGFLNTSVAMTPFPIVLMVSLYTNN